ncbi:MAG: efflux RND transporter periplasmic adaptor subunit [Rikenellaceae bacterium]|nr:efflux RND transporter periplasmic adaptor subunit [Rikenellaceae bacterium]MCL2692845.1 efflux RND transporter periplasmic adaptor subunit [Rikenellaceae bacterium]
MKKELILLVALAMIITACGGGRRAAETAATEQEEERVVLVRTAVATLEDVEQTAVFTSNIAPAQQNSIAPQAPGRIDRILVDVGATVTRGQLLATMDPTTYNQVAVQLANAEADYERIKRVYDAGGVSKQTLDQVETQVAVARTQAANLRENVELRSPIAGVVTARNFDPGNLYNGAVPLLVVMQISTVKVTLSVPERFFPMVRKGMAAAVTVDVYPGRTFEGKVSLVHPAIDMATRTFTLEVEIPNPAGELRPGMFSRTELSFGSEPGVMIPDVAIQRQAGTNDRYVFVEAGGVAERRLVTTGVQVGDRVNILSGVEPGDRVVVAGISRLMQGTRVREE